jgi:Fe-S cluster biogenesis protein NfuA
MAENKENCTHPENLHGHKAGECSPAQKQICHPGEVRNKGESVDNKAEIQKVQTVLDKVRPNLQADGGDVELVDVQNGIVKIKLTGHCAGCPMSQMTLKNGIERVLKQELPEVKQVIAA